MDQGTVPKETLINILREAISHVNRNLYEWTVGMKKSKVKFTITFSEVRGLTRNWLIRSLRDKIGYAEADRVFKGLYITIEPDNSAIQSISLSSEGKHCKTYNPINEILRSMNFKNLHYNPDDYVMDGMSERKAVFDPFFYFSTENIKQIKF